MSCYSKEKTDRNDYNNICKSHSARSDRELYRICPSKLSKRELEDLYFSLLENNIDLKRTINGQQDKIKGLSTKVQRMSTTQKIFQSKELKDCCVGTKSILTEQKESITELKRTNQRLAERIQLLNMRLCSAKQFFKKTPQASTSRCLRCATAGSSPKKHNCLDKASEPVLKLSTSIQCDDRCATSMKSAQTESRELDRPPSEPQCDENKCRSLMEELKMKIVHLQEELCQVHDEYSTRIGRLESEVSDVRRENIRVHAGRRASDLELQNTARRTSEILSACRNTEAKCAELAAQLSIEKRKVAELETQLRAANMSDKVNRTIEDHLTTIIETNGLPQATSDSTQKSGCCTCATSDKTTAKTIKSDACACPILGDSDEPANKSIWVKNISKSSSSKVSSKASKASKSSKKEPKSVTCACPTQKDELVPSTDDTKEANCGCPAPLTIPSSLPKDSKTVVCGCPSPKETSTPTKVNKGVDCGCPPWQEDEKSNCMKCCYKDHEGGVSESFLSKAGTRSSSRVTEPRWSPTKHDESKPSKTSDDSGYMDPNRSQDTDDQAVHKLNKELITKILELQSQMESMKMTGPTELSGSRRTQVSVMSPTPNNSLDESAISTTAEKSGGQIENQNSMKAENRTTTNKPISISDNSWASEDQGTSRSGIGVNKQMLDLPERGETRESFSRPIRKRLSEDTRAKTLQDSEGRLQLAEDRRPSNTEKLYLSPILLQPNDTDIPGKLEMPERGNPKLEFSNQVRYNTGSVEEKFIPDTLKMPEPKENMPSKSEPEFRRPSFATNEIQKPYTPELNPDKLKYMEAEGRTANPELGVNMPKLAPVDNQGAEPTESVIESIPSNPELGLVPRFQQTKPKDEIFPEDPKMLKEEQAPNGIDILPGKLTLPMTDAVLANNVPKPTDVPTTSTEGCERCAACSFNKECGLRLSKPTNDSIITKNGLGTKTAQNMKHDQHNSLQIPGPIPTADTNGKDKKKSVFKHFSLDKKKDKSKDKSGKHKKESLNKEVPVANKKLSGDQLCVTTLDPNDLADVPLLSKTKKKIDPSLADVSRGNYYTPSKDSIITHHKRLSNSMHTSIIKSSPGAPMQDASMHNFYPHSDRALPTLSAEYNSEEATQVEGKTDGLQEIDQTKPQDQPNQALNNIEGAWRARVEGRKRDVSVYRRSSGTLCFRTLPAADLPRDCRCAGSRDAHCGAMPAHKGIQVEGSEENKAPKQHRTSLASDQGTYTVGSKQTRGTSPDNTDLEMSNLSDLPMEKEKKSPAKYRPLSPGEEKMTTTYTDSYCTPNTTFSLSEGEMPATSKRKVSYDPDKERQINAAPAPKLEESATSQKMEAALQAITEELARCKTLLQTQRPSETPRRESCHSQTSVADTKPIALRRGIATQSIGDAYAPKCVFTLHIGTIVLSDEAVLNSRDKTMVLTWKFYDQNIAMTRMRAGRVVLFDFSTEYDIKITDEFLNYMKHEEMPIVICELDKEDQPFASCALPLRDALLHTNRRADMSLPLVAGAQMLSARAELGSTADSLDGRDEMGVIDLWCMLRADANMLPGINLAIAQPSAPVALPHEEPRNSRVMPQILDDDHYADLELTRVEAAPFFAPEQTGHNVYGNVEYTRTSHQWSIPSKSTAADSDANTQTATSTRAEMSYDPNNYPPMRSRRLSGGTIAHGVQPVQPPTSDIMQDDPERDSGIIINEVRAKIRSQGDMRHALEKSCLQNEFNRLPSKPEEDLPSLAHSSLGSLRSVLARLQRRGSRSTQTPDNPQRTVIQNIMGNSKCGPDVSNKSKEASDLEIYKKYENISKLVGSNRAEASKKCVKILPKYTSGNEVPQRDVGDEQGEDDQDRGNQNLEITVLWLALNEECEAMIDPHVQRVYVAYTFLGRTGAELETPVSLPKPKHYVDKCYFNFKKTFELEDTDLLKLSHMARCRAASKMSEDERDCIVFSVVSEPPEDPLGLESCEDIGYAYLYLGDLLAYSAGSPGYTEVIPVRAARGAAAVCGVLAVRLDGLDVVRRCLLLPSDEHLPAGNKN